MADQPQNPQSPNAGRISSMLQDLSAQRDNQPAAPALPPRPVAQATVGGPPPPNLPIGQAPAAPVRVPAPAAPAPVPQQPTVTAPKPPPLIPPATPPVTVNVTVQAPAAPIAPRPAVPAPQPAGAIAPPRPAPPPAPREIPATAAPKPAAPPPPPPAPAAAPASGPQYASELRTMSTDIGSMQVGQPPAAVRPMAAPAAPTAPQAPAPAPQITIAPTIVIPAASSGGGGKKMLLFAGLGLLVLALVAVVVWAFFSGGGEVAVETPTPSAAPTLTLAPQVKSLSAYFGLPKATATIIGTDTAVTDFRNTLLTAEPAAKQATSIQVMRSDAPMTPSAFVTVTLGEVPPDVTGSFGTDWVALAYGQTEAFDSAGAPLAEAPDEPALALVIEVADASKANQAMQAWEGTSLDVSASKLFGYFPENAIVTGFSSGTYREVPMRYRNFPYADKSLDWAMALGSNGKNYLILTGSRESAFFVVDQLMQ